MDEYGFERPDDFDYKSYEEFISSYLKVLARRAKKWRELLGDNRSVKRNLTMKRYVRKGIPAEYRGKVSKIKLLFTIINLLINYLLFIFRFGWL